MVVEDVSQGGGSGWCRGREGCEVLRFESSAE